MRLLLVRHGQTTSNVGHHLDTAYPGADLTDLGRRQAAAIPEALAGEDIGAVFTSDLVRTVQTAAPLVAARGLTPYVRPGLREIAAGDFEMRNDHEAIEAYVETVFGWGDDLDRRLPGGETGREVLTRFDEVVAEISGLGHDTVMIVAHGAILRVWAGFRCAGLDSEYAAHHWLPNTAMIVCEGSPGEGWRLESWLSHALGGATLDDDAHTGPAGEPEELND